MAWKDPIPPEVTITNMPTQTGVVKRTSNLRKNKNQDKAAEVLHRDSVNYFLMT